MAEKNEIDVSRSGEEPVSRCQYLPPKQHAEKHGWPDGGIRHLLFNRKKNGLAKCVIRVGRGLRINQKCWDDWLNEHREA